MKNVTYILRLALTLLIITSLVAVALAAVNSVTAPMIQAAKEQKLQTAINEVLEGGYDTVIEEFDDRNGLVNAVYKGANGYAVEVCPNGFGGGITMMVGIGNEGEILGIAVVSHAETPSLGAVAAAKGSAGEEFRGQFVGMSGQVFVDKDGGEVDSISGATITSRAICDGVNAALSCVAGLG